MCIRITQREVLNPNTASIYELCKITPWRLACVTFGSSKYANENYAILQQFRRKKNTQKRSRNSISNLFLSINNERVEHHGSLRWCHRELMNSKIDDEFKKMKMSRPQVLLTVKFLALKYTLIECELLRSFTGAWRSLLPYRTRGDDIVELRLGR